MIMADDSTVRNKNNNIPDVQTMYPYPGCTKSKIWEYFGLLKKLYLLFEINTYGSSPLSRHVPNVGYLSRCLIILHPIEKITTDVTKYIINVT